MNSGTAFLNCENPTTESPLAEAERSVLGAFLYDGEKPLPNAALAEAREHLVNGEEFSTSKHRLIFSAMVELAEAGSPITLVTLSTELDKRGQLDGVGGVDYLAEIAEAISTSANVDFHSKMIKEAHQNKCLDALLGKARLDLKDGMGRGAVIAELKNRLEGFQSAPFKKLQSLESIVLDYPQLLKAEIPERENILDWLAAGGLAMLYAPRGTAKTFCGVSLAASIVTTTPFMKWKILKACGVLYIDGEMPLTSLRERITGFLPNSPTAPLLTLSHEVFYRETERDLCLSDEVHQNIILAHLDQNPAVRVLIVDNLSSLTKIREDKGDDWRESVFPFLMKCRRRGVAVLLIHHAGKNGDQRGTGAREDALDITIKLSVADDSYKDGAYFRVDFTKARGVFGETVKPFTAKLLKGPDGFFSWELKDVEESTDDRLMKLITETGGISVTDAADELGLSKGAISKAKKRLLEKGLLKKSLPGSHSLMELSGGL